MAADTTLDLALIPGASCDERLFAPQIDALDGAVRAHVVDNSAHPRIEDLARSALDRLPERFALAGLSMGGLVACEIVRQAPRRVLGLALLDTPDAVTAALQRWLDRVRRHDDQQRPDAPTPAPSTPGTAP